MIVSFAMCVWFRAGIQRLEPFREDLKPVSVNLHRAQETNKTCGTALGYRIALFTGPRIFNVTIRNISHHGESGTNNHSSPKQLHLQVATLLLCSE